MINKLLKDELIIAVRKVFRTNKLERSDKMDGVIKKSIKKIVKKQQTN